MVNVYSQQVQIEGTVTDENNEPFPNVKIIGEDEQLLTRTDEMGAYSLIVETGKHITFSHAGYYTMTVLVEDDSPINMVMERDNASIMALFTGGYSDKKAQGYAVSTLCGTQLSDNLQKDFSRMLEGTTAGIMVKPQSGFVGSSNLVTIRGLNTINGSSHPLYVVDGVPFDTTITHPGNPVCGDLGSNRSFDIDPNNIESVKILKGLAATNLYGSLGRNGVVLITTKSGAYASR